MRVQFLDNFHVVIIIVLKSALKQAKVYAHTPRAKKA